LRDPTADVALRGGNVATRDPETAMNERDIFINALQKDPAERPAYLDEACAGNPALRRRIDALLKAHDDPDGFLDSPPAVDATSITSSGQTHPSTLADDAAIPDDAPASTRDARVEATLKYDLPAGPIAAPAPRPITEGPGSRIGPYKLLQKIGEGGMGAVYMAEQEKPVRRRVALKVIKPGMDTDQVIARFEAERQALAIMDHNNIAKVLDAGATETGRPYFVMELVNGIPITDYCDRANLSPGERLELFIPVCQAIQHAHQKGVIHRDIKPSNVLVTLHDGKPVPKIIDFGVAKAISQRLTERTMFTQFGAVVGTLEYMSPEQAEMSGMDVDTRTDVYALGVLLYELLTGTTPLQRASLREAAFAEILRRIREEDPQKPSTRISESGENLASISAHRKTEPVRLARLVRGELDWIVMKSLEKDRSRR
jgi:tRNA A-37 threonylcarbamoyl transferase component Bud32